MSNANADSHDGIAIALSLQTQKTHDSTSKRTCEEVVIDGLMQLRCCPNTTLWM